MKVEARTEIVINGESVTHRQLEALDAVARLGSMSGAAKEMGVTVPVVHRYLANIESAAGEPVSKSTPSGRGKRGFPAAPRQRPRESFFNASRGPSPLP